MNSTPRSHRHDVRIYFEDTDAGMIVYHSRYLNYCERARAEFLRDLGIDSSSMMRQHKCGFAVRRAEMDFIKPAQLDDLLTIETTLVKIGGASATARHEIKRGEDRLVDIEIVLVCIDGDMRATRIPDPVRDAMADWVAPNDIG